MPKRHDPDVEGPCVAGPWLVDQPPGNSVRAKIPPQQLY